MTTRATLEKARDWFRKALAPGDAATDYLNGEDGRTDGQDGWDDAERVLAAIEAALEEKE